MKKPISSLLFAASGASVAALLVGCSSAPESASPTQDGGVEVDSGEAADPSTDPGATPPVLGDVSASSACLADGTIHDPNPPSPACNIPNSDCRRTPNSNSTNWFKNWNKNECASGDWMTGVSTDSARKNHAFNCAMSPYTSAQGATSCHTVNYSLALPFPNGSSATNWDPGMPKAECATSEYMAGYAEDSNGYQGTILCCTFAGKTPNTNCNAVAFSGTTVADNRESTTTGNWDTGYSRLECGDGRAVAGLSTTIKAGTVGGTEKIHGVLCCDAPAAFTPPATTATNASTCCNNTSFPASVSKCLADTTANASFCSIVDYCCQTGVSSYAGSTSCSDTATAEADLTEGTTGLTVTPKTPPTAVATTATGAWSYANTLSDVRGTTLFGAGYEGDVTLSASKAGTKVDALGDAKLTGSATLFGHAVSLARIEANGQLSTETVNATINALGMDVYTYGLSGIGLYSASKSYTQTFFAQTRTFTVGPVPITVSGSVTGSFGYADSIGFQSGQFTLGAGPYLLANANVSAALGGGVHGFSLTAGVSGQLMLFSAGIQDTVTLTPTTSNVVYNAAGTSTITEINGSLAIFLKMQALFYKKTYSYTMVSFNGLSQTAKFLNYAGTQAW
jgi:hypothetical protein